MDRTIQLKVLGSFTACWSDGEPIKFSSKKAQALIAYLATENDRPQPREQLAALLWGEVSDARARHNLRQALSKIRGHCPDLVAADLATVSINGAGCSVDALEFNTLWRSDNPEQLGRCLALYRGELLEGLNSREPLFDEWLILARSRFRQQACEVADRYVQLLLAQGNAEQAINALNQRLLIDPACEPAHVKLMELLNALGRRSDALRQYQQCVEAMRRELGAEPSGETEAAYRRLIDDAALPTAAESPAVIASPQAAQGHQRPTVAVLPFDNLASSSDDYFVDGMVEEITTALSHFHALQVIARGSAFVYRDLKESDRQIADELGAQYLVRGSVRRAGERVRINVHLLDAVAGHNLWSHRYDRKLEDIFELQDEITATLVSTLAGKVEAARLARARKAPPERLDAYDMLLRGKEHHHRFTAEDCRTCVSLFEQAIERDPSYALAHAWLACGLGQAIVFELDETPRLVDRSQEAAERGLALDENDAESHRVLAQINLTRRDMKRAMYHQERALFLNPNDDQSVNSMGEILSYLGRHAEALEWVRKSMRLNPYHPERYWTHLARPLFHLERFEEALAALERIGRLRMDDHGYRVAASAGLQDKNCLAGHVAALRRAFPGFDAAAFVESLPYEHALERETLLRALQMALDE